MMSPIEMEMIVKAEQHQRQAHIAEYQLASQVKIGRNNGANPVAAVKNFLANLSLDNVSLVNFKRAEELEGC